MENVTNTGINKDYYWQDDSKVPKADENNGQLTQEDFFSLLTEQLSMQDPTKPVDNDKMVQQMTSFTMADSLSSLNQKFDQFAQSMTSNQALQASSLVGQQVLLQSSNMVLKEGQPVTGVIVNESRASNMKLTIENQYGETVRVMDAGSQDAGNIDFGWDGTDQNGNPVPPGNYKLTASATVDGEQTTVPTAIHRHVNSVSMGSNGQGVILNLYGDESVTLGDVMEIG
ncbi:Basal-body rod modification protein FlgD [Saliniradius amylolyticus]|uniref:Basal-body rod modification protein FlgD n=1 Tax=Saliniradius amylolyticus TaxID=2183582 RepID=A0A2S2E139_9ALTE|nr:flagellar hook assembly protein FlgD [Saliniradius amylolyticus]AWL11326.1 Basal-body rod modification protein FlgD [Saliniradius amylolyticus]